MADQEGGQETKTTIKVGDVEYSADKIQELTQQLEANQPLIELAQRYELDPTQLANETQGAFGALLQLREAGILDEQGNVVEKKQEQKKQEQNTNNQSTNQPNNQQLNADQIAQRALDSVNPSIKALTDEVTTLRTSLNRLYREKIQDAVKAKGLDVTDDDINLSLAKSKSTGKDFWDVLGERAKTYTSREEAAVKKFAEDHGLDLADLNKIKDAHTTEGGVAQSIIAGRKISSKSGKGSDTISPREATQKLFEMMR